MLNLFQHPDLSMSYETLKRVQGDKFGFVQQATYTAFNWNAFRQDEHFRFSVTLWLILFVHMGNIKTFAVLYFL